VESEEVSGCSQVKISEERLQTAGEKKAPLKCWREMIEGKKSHNNVKWSATKKGENVRHVQKRNTWVMWGRGNGRPSKRLAQRTGISNDATETSVG